MAITQTSATGEVAKVTTNSGSASVTVPADAEIMIVGVSANDTGANYISGGTMTIAGASMTAITGGDASTSFWDAGAFYKLLPTTGTQTLAWDFAGTNAPSGGGAIISYTFWKGINTS